MRNTDPWAKVHGTGRWRRAREAGHRAAYAARTPAIALALLLFALSAAVGSLTDFAGARAARTGAEAAQEAAEAAGAQVAGLQARLDCRAALRDEVDRLQNERQAALADGLAAFAQENRQALALQAARITMLKADIDAALARLADASRLCPA